MQLYTLEAVTVIGVEWRWTAGLVNDELKRKKIVLAIWQQLGQPFSVMAVDGWFELHSWWEPYDLLVAYRTRSIWQKLP